MPASLKECGSGIGLTPAGNIKSRFPGGLWFSDCFDSAWRLWHIVLGGVPFSAGRANIKILGLDRMKEGVFEAKPL